METAAYHHHVRHLEALYTVALQSSGFDAAVVHSGRPKKRSEFDDQFFPHRTTPEFLRWLPLDEPDCFLVVEPGKRTSLFWPKNTSFWERPRPPENDHFMDVLDVRREPSPPRLAGKRVAFLGEDRARAEELSLGEVNPPALLAALDALRTKKTAYEVACLAEANRRAALGHESLKRAFASDERSELDLHLMYLGSTKQDDQETPYKNIVAFGENAAVLHHVSYGRDAVRAESLLVDAGATCAGYCADITRTWVRPRGAAGETFAGLVAAMEAMQQRIVAKIAVGMAYEELHDESHRQVSVILKESGLALGSVEEIDQRGVSRVFYPHGLGHSLGLQTHDVGCAVIKPRADNPFLRNTSVIEVGQVFTIEPGLYFIDGLLAELRERPEGKLVNWDLVERLAPLGGVRIEDDIYVSEDGVRNLTREVLPIGGGTL